jgi:hypothetical protein
MLSIIIVCLTVGLALRYPMLYAYGIRITVKSLGTFHATLWLHWRGYRLPIRAGEFHDQGDIKWIVIRGQLKGQNDHNSGCIWWFKLLLIRNILL